MNSFLRLTALSIVVAVSGSMAAAQVLPDGYTIITPEEAKYATALKKLQPLAEQGDAKAQNNLGEMYAQGQGVPQDYAQAIKLYRLAAEQGNADAQYNLGLMYRIGQGGVLQDYAEAVKWYRLAAEQGYGVAQGQLGFMYSEGWGVLQDYTTAHMWYNLASVNGFARGSQHRDIVAAEMTPKDISKAQRRARVCLESQYKECD